VEGDLAFSTCQTRERHSITPPNEMTVEEDASLRKATLLSDELAYYSFLLTRAEDDAHAWRIIHLHRDATPWCDCGQPRRPFSDETCAAYISQAAAAAAVSSDKTSRSESESESGSGSGNLSPNFYPNLSAPTGTGVYEGESDDLTRVDDDLGSADSTVLASHPLANEGENDVDEEENDEDVREVDDGNYGLKDKYVRRRRVLSKMSERWESDFESGEEEAAKQSSHVSVHYLSSGISYPIRGEVVTSYATTTTTTTMASTSTSNSTSSLDNEVLGNDHDHDDDDDIFEVDDDDTDTADRPNEEEEEEEGFDATIYPWEEATIDVFIDRRTTGSTSFPDMMKKIESDPPDPDYILDWGPKLPSGHGTRKVKVGSGMGSKERQPESELARVTKPSQAEKRFSLRWLKEMGVALTTVLWGLIRAKAAR
jgi:hypothetical protein